MNNIELRLKEINPELFALLRSAINEVELLLQSYSKNFPTYTDHSLNHTKQVFSIVSQMLTIEEINNLNGEELYVLGMASILHDIGMCLPEEALINKINSNTYIEYKDSSPQGTTNESLIRDIHHELSYDFIKNEQELLKIPNEQYAEAIAIVAKGHRKVQLDDIEVYKPKCFVKDGRDFVCLPYLASVLRLADELDITNIRTPKLLTKYYMPNNAISIKEWEKHIATTQINYTEDKIIFHVNCSDQNNLAALEEQFEKIQDVANYTQKIIRNISNTESRTFNLSLSKIQPEYKYIGFDPKGIKFSFNVNNVVNTFVGEDLYKNDLTAIREVLQNAIDSSRYKISLQIPNYVPEIKVELHDNKIIVHDNALGMDEFIIENFFGKLGSSYYAEEEVKSNYEAIGQFGVGVFSYFLLGEFIDIETKTKKYNALKFRIDRDPKNYFHFYPFTRRKKSGTSITLHLSEKVKEKYTKSDYVDYIQRTFRYIEFPIVIINDKTNIKIKKRELKGVYFEEIQKRIKYKYRGRADEFTTVVFQINNNEIEGECALIIPAYDKFEDFVSISQSFDYESFQIEGSNMPEISSIQISQKGVYVDEYASNLLSYTIGQINVKKSLPININRNEFSNENDVNQILDLFCLGLIENLFKKIETTTTQERHSSFSYDFLSTYINYISTERSTVKQKNNIRDTLGNNLMIKCYTKKGFSYERLFDFVNSSSEFILLAENEDIKKNYEEYGKPVLLASGVNRRIGNFRLIMDLLEDVFNLEPSIFFYDKFSYIKYSKGNSHELLTKQKKIIKKFFPFQVSRAIKFDSTYIGASLTHDVKELVKDNAYSMDGMINLNHEFIIHIIKHSNKINESHELKKITREAFELIQQIMLKRKEFARGVSELNDLIKLIYFEGNSYKFIESDFIL